MNAYKDTEMKNHLWSAKAEEWEIESAILKTWFDSMRTYFRKLAKNQSGDGAADNTETDQWLPNILDFIHQHIVWIRGRTTVGLKAKLARQTAAATAEAEAPVAAPVAAPILMSRM